MPTTDLAKQAEAVRAGITRLEADLEALLKTVGGAIGASVGGRVSETLEVLAGHVEPLLALLGASATPARRGPGRPRKGAGEAAPRKSRRGGKRKKANLTAEKIAAALKQTGGNKSAAAKLLGVSQPTFYKYLKNVAVPSAERSEATPRARRRAPKQR